MICNFKMVLPYIISPKWEIPPTPHFFTSVEVLTLPKRNQQEFFNADRRDMISIKFLVLSSQKPENWCAHYNRNQLTNQEDSWILFPSSHLLIYINLNVWAYGDNFHVRIGFTHSALGAENGLEEFLVRWRGIFSPLGFEIIRNDLKISTVLRVRMACTI